MPKAGRPEARGEVRGVGSFDGLAASTATTVREVGINKTERQAGSAQRAGRANAKRESVQALQVGPLSRRAAQALCVSGPGPAVYIRFLGRAVRAAEAARGRVLYCMGSKVTVMP